MGDEAEEEYLTSTASAEACRDLVIQHRGAATGMAWSTNDYDNDGLGSCYAEYGATRFHNAGTSHYLSCIFDGSSTQSPTTEPIPDDRGSSMAPQTPGPDSSPADTTST